MSIGAVANCPEMVVNSVKAVMGSKCKCMDRDDDYDGGDDDEEQEAEQDELLFQVTTYCTRLREYLPLVLAYHASAGSRNLATIFSCMHVIIRPFPVRWRGPAGAGRGAGVAVAVLALLRRPLRQPPQEDQAQLHTRGEVVQV